MSAAAVGGPDWGGPDAGAPGPYGLGGHLHGRLAEAERDRPGTALLSEPHGGGWRSWSAGELAAQAERVAAGLASRVAPGDRVLLAGRGGREWLLADLALLSLGAVSVPVYPTASAAQVRHLVGDSRPVLALTAGPVQALPGPPVVPVADLLAASAPPAPARPVPPDAVATLVYTSGTTGRPKGCALTHANLAAAVAALPAVAPGAVGPDARAIAFLPPAHAYPRVLALTLLATRTPTWTADQAHLAAALAHVRPTLVPGVPRAFAKLHSAAAGGERAATAAALRVVLGGECRYALSAGAPLPEEVGAALTDAGVAVLDAWGMTETTTLGAMTRPGGWRPGVVGPASPGTELRIAADGELHVRGPGSFAGYWGDPEASAAVLSPDGWLRTGDLAEIADGELRLRGRAKDVLVTAGGKNVAPGPLEDALGTEPLVGGAVVVGDGRPFVAALLVLDRGALDRRGLPGPEEAVLLDLGREPGPTSTVLAGSLHPDVHRALDAAVARANSGVSRAESVRRYAVLPGELTIAQDELTPTLKVRRGVVTSRNARVVEELYR